MFQGELASLIGIYIQPPFIGLLLFGLTRQSLSNQSLFSHLRAARKRFKGVRFFECAAYPRLLGRLRYDLQALSLAVVFLIYDVDLLFFFSEVYAADYWSFYHLFLFILYGLFFIAGLWYDVVRQGLGWSN